MENTGGAKRLKDTICQGLMSNSAFLPLPDPLPPRRSRVEEAKIRQMLVNSGALYSQPAPILVDLLRGFRDDLQDVLELRFYCERDERGRVFVRRREKPLKRKYRLPRCGAKTRKGTPCQMLVELGKKRCRLHGGRSTGPKTAEGRARIAESNRRRAKTYQITETEQAAKAGKS